MNDDKYDISMIKVKETPQETSDDIMFSSDDRFEKRLKAEERLVGLLYLYPKGDEFLEAIKEYSPDQLSHFVLRCDNNPDILIGLEMMIGARLVKIQRAINSFDLPGIQDDDAPAREKELKKLLTEQFGIVHYNIAMLGNLLGLEVELCDNHVTIAH